MAVKSEEENGLLKLTIDNGDLTKFHEAMEKWNFRDYQSLLRFVISLLVLNENNYVSIKLNGIEQNIVPVSSQLKDNGHDNDQQKSR